MPDLPKLRRFLRHRGLRYDTPGVEDPQCLIAWARDPAGDARGLQRARQYIRELQQMGRHVRDRRAIHARLRQIVRGDRLFEGSFHPCKGQFTRIYKLKTHNTRMFLFKWRSVWFLISGTDKRPGARVENEAMKQADRIRRQMEQWLDEQPT